MITEKELKHVKEQDAHWHKVGGVVCDVINLLENLSRVHPNGLSEHQAAALTQAKEKAVRVASHALRPVLTALNDEMFQWSSQIEEQEYERELEQAAS